MLLAAVFLPLPAAVGPTTAVLVLLVTLAIVGLLAARSRAASRTGAGAGSAGPRLAKLEPNLVNIRIADDDPPPVEEVDPVD